MATKTKLNRIEQLAADQKLADGTKQFLSQNTSLTVGSEVMTPAQIVQVFDDRVATGKAAVAAEDARKAAVKADRAERAKTAAFVHAFKRLVIAMYLQSPDTLGFFGLSAPKTGKRSVATKAAAVAQASATKKARGPIGRKQRAKVKAPPVTTTSPQPSSAAPPATPAPSPVVAPEPPTPAPGAAGASPVAPAPKAGS
jgi:hypothetical protein